MGSKEALQMLIFNAAGLQIQPSRERNPAEQKTNYFSRQDHILSSLFVQELFFS
jgi:hypothetical protein